MATFDLETPDAQLRVRVNHDALRVVIEAAPIAALRMTYAEAVLLRDDLTRAITEAATQAAMGVKS